MALYFVDYDLRKQRDYQKLYDALKAFGAIRVLESLWAFSHSNTSCVQVRDHLKQFIDADDGLVVSQVADWASYKPLATPPNT
jgi:CRISPR/Cas system-associated endoribonuclease Cas2